MKIGVITFHASHNYGSMLQAWALQSFLKELGHQVFIVNYRSKAQKDIYHRPISFVRYDVALATFKRLLLYPSSIKGLFKKWHLFEKFLKEEFNSTREYSTIEELKNTSHEFDMLICGSDQIWNTNVKDSNEAYYGTWFPRKKISYAASCGPYPEKCDIIKISSKLTAFNAVSVREQRLCSLLSDHGISNVKVVCDPTLLLHHEQYDKLAGDTPIVKGKYVFFYTHIGHSPHYLQMANQIGEKLSLPVICEKAYYKHEITRFEHIKRIIDVGPKEFLNLIKFATYICGDSFHLQVFAILFKKDFSCFNGDKDSRTRTLLQQLGLENQIVKINHRDRLIKNHIETYDEVDERIEEYKKNSLYYLSENIK